LVAAAGNFLFDFFAPNRCYYCGKLGDLVCGDCLAKQNFSIKVVARRAKYRATRDFYLSDREGVLRKLVDDMKFNNHQENYQVLAQILAQALVKNQMIQRNRPKIILIPAPTSEKHLRQRGFGHTEAISQELARILELRTQSIITRKTNFVQHGASAKVRKSQAAQSYELSGELDPEAIYCVFDDIRTTGSTLDAISGILLENGAQEVWNIYLMQQQI
jgi:ComF family protein